MAALGWPASRSLLAIRAPAALLVLGAVGLPGCTAIGAFAQGYVEGAAMAAGASPLGRELLLFGQECTMQYERRLLHELSL